jgi:hypothetical protein
MKTRNVVAFMIAFLLIAQFSFAQTADKMLDSWKLLGTRVVDYTLDRDVVTLNPSKTSVTGLKFLVKNGTINMHKATVHFANGDTQDIDFADQVNAANDGRIVELKGNSRAIEKVTFWYDTKNSSKDKSTVEVWGK